MNKLLTALVLLLSLVACSEDAPNIGRAAHVGWVSCESLATVACAELAETDPDHDADACISAEIEACEAER